VGGSGAVLVTGGAGYVGSVTTRWLAETGRPVVVLDDLSTGHRDVVRFGPLEEGDVGDEAFLRAVIRRHGVVAILHFAAKALVAESVADPELYDRWNRGKTTVLAGVAASEGVGAIVFSSTCAVYGTPAVVPIPEEEPRRPVNPYGLSKAASEDALVATGLPVACLRYFNAAGAEPEHDLGERHAHETHLVPLAIRAALGGEPLTIFGSDHPTPDGTCVRDYVHVGDLARAHLLALERLEGGRGGGAWNLGTGRGASVREVVAAVGRVLGREVPTVEGPRREGDPPALVASAHSAFAALGWRAEASDLLRIVGDAARFEEGRRGRRRASPRARPHVVAIDGPAGAGKSSLARRLADDLGWAWLDTGAMYRAVTLLALERGVAATDEERLAELTRALVLELLRDGTVLIGGRDVTQEIRSERVTAAVSAVAAVPGVRRVMVVHQHAFARREGRIVAEGRDIGSVVFPEAEVKIYLDARPEDRARRRLGQERPGAAETEPGAVEEVLQGISERDRLDRTRSVAPLRPAPDAWRLDTSGMTLEQVFAAVRSHVRSRIHPESGSPSA
jgi:UDP-arabinose 4-epimerase